MKLRLSSADKLTKREAHVSQREEDSRLWADRIRAGLEPPASPWRTRERVVEAVRDGSPDPSRLGRLHGPQSLSGGPDRP